MKKQHLRLLSAVISCFLTGTVIQVNAVEPGPVFRDIQPKDEVSDFFEKQWANVLIVNDDDDKEKADGIISAMIKDVDKGYTPLVRYEEGCVYKTRNNDKLRFIKYGYDNFMSLGDNSYKSKYIVDSTSHIFYVLGKNSSLDHLKAFHDKFNRIWCGSDFVYDDEKSFVPSSNEYRVFYSTVAAKRYDKRNTRDVFLFFGCNESDYEKFMEDRPGLERYYQRMPGMEKQLYGEANFSWEKLKVGLPKDATLYPRQPYNVHCMNHESSLVRSVLSLCPDALLASEGLCPGKKN